MQLNTLQDSIAANKTVLVRVDYNVPLKKKGDKYVVAEAKRITDSLPLLEFLLKNNAKVILISHLGRPQGKSKPKLSLKPAAEYLNNNYEFPVKFIDQVIGREVEQAAAELKPGQVLLLENLRFHPEERENNQQFAQQLASLADIYVNEAFSTSHRKHASIQAVAELLPAYAGLHLQHEVENLSRIMTDPKHPFVVVVGGAKLSTKIEAVYNLHKIAEIVLVGGGVANNFLKAEGIETHMSTLKKEGKVNEEELDYLAMAQQIVAENKTEKVLKDGYIPLPKILTPIDVVAGKNFDSTDTEVINLTSGMADTPDDEDLMYLDIGPLTIKLFTDLILQAGTIFWSGPMGVFEKKPFENGTREIARAIAKSGAETFVGGGDTITAINKYGFEGRFDYTSSAGGAALEFLAEKKMPGIEVLKK